MLDWVLYHPSIPPIICLFRDQIEYTYVFQGMESPV